MKYPSYFDSKNSCKLYGYEKEFFFLSYLYRNKKLPKVLLISGNKGLGKSTLINHFLFSIFDEKNYDSKNSFISETSNIFKQFKDNLFPNIIYLKGSYLKSIKIEDIRTLKNEISKSTIINKERFIILDDVELFNLNSSNALLKTIEEPNKKDYFILINNNSRPLLETIKSRSLEIKIILDEKKKVEIIDNLISFLKIEKILDPTLSKLTPGNFIKFNYIFKEKKILIDDSFIKNLSSLLTLYKKEKDILFIHIAFFISNYYFNNLIRKKSLNNDIIIEKKNFVFKNLNDLLIYNINQNSFINAVNYKLNNE